MRIAVALIPATILALLAHSGTAHGQVTLEFKFPEGRTSTYESTTSVVQTLSVAGQEIPTQSSQTSVSTTSNGAPRDNGQTPVTQTVESIRVDLSLPGGIQMTIDSAKPEQPTGELPQLQTIRKTIEALAGISYTVLFGPGGTVEGVEGLDKAIPDTVDKEVADALKERLSAEVIKRELTQEYGVLPKEPVSEGETWEVTEIMNLGEGQTFTFQRAYTYEGTVEQGGKTLDRLTIASKSVEYAMDNPASPLTVEESDLKVSSSSGEVLFDREAGQIVSSKNTMEIVGNLVLSAGGQELPAELTLSITTGNTLGVSQ